MRKQSKLDVGAHIHIQVIRLENWVIQLLIAVQFWSWKEQQEKKKEKQTNCALLRANPTSTQEQTKMTKKRIEV